MVEEIVGPLPEGVEVPPELAGCLLPAETDGAKAPQPQPCVICGQHMNPLSRTGRCPECKGKRLQNNADRISAARAKLGMVEPAKSPDEIIKAKDEEIASLRAAMNSAHPLPLADFAARVNLMRHAGIESYEDHGIRIVMKADVKGRSNADTPLIE